ncbi:FAD-dependent oxidoreductase [Variovorax sp. OV329]|uniref:FAD-dependent oxidoreductase n=1 Tax=Variovorax sp. OV329 TaxID=1882825 RepID=UPI0008F200B7|nr:FAD-dependent oxidoreductase [Variovorax sp. OV329]SFM77707.1 ABC-type amino acid transport substrate-binding protein [Variovorax sp. OV329]
MGSSIAVVGAGIVGVSCALALQRRGWQVTLIDRSPPGRETSFGNAGVLARSSLIPFNNPGLWSALPTLLRNSGASFRYDPAYLARNLPWALRFVLHARRGSFERTTEALDGLIKLSWQEHLRWLGEAGVRQRLRENGWLFLYRTQAAFQRGQPARDTFERFGITTQVLDAWALYALEPSLRPIFARALWVQDAASVDSPGRVVEAYAALFVSRGGCIVQQGVSGLARPDGGDPWRILMADGGVREADQVVVALGPWSAEFLRSTQALSVPMAFERGHHMHYGAAPDARLSRPVYDTAGGYVLSPMEQGLRLTTGASRRPGCAAQAFAVEPGGGRGAPGLSAGRAPGRSALARQPSHLAGQPARHRPVPRPASPVAGLRPPAHRLQHGPRHGGAAGSPGVGRALSHRPCALQPFALHPLNGRSSLPPPHPKDPPMQRRDFLNRSLLAATAAAIQPAAFAQGGGESTWERVKRTRVLRVGAVDGGLPYYRKDIVTGEWQGCMADYYRGLAKSLDARLEITPTSWGNSVLELQSQKIDVFFGLNPTPARQQVIDFTDPLLRIAFTALCRKGFSPNSWADLNKPAVRVAVDKGSSQDAIATRILVDAQIIRLDSAVDATLAVQTGRADAQILVLPLALSVSSKNPAVGQVVILTPEEIATSNGGVRKEADGRWLQHINLWLKGERESGNMRRIFIENLKKVGDVSEDKIPAHLQI